ncbi:MAG: lipoprotein-releasing system ATP-binding protein LolD [Spirochaetes bacterium]|nr:MAG: lipoprotein-releasing system ATP-binding protein LolD [Spirochaetota bacterium]
MSKIIEIAGLHKVYRTGAEDLSVLNDINVSIAKNCSLTITGHSGSGKSTLLNLISGLDFPTAGSIEVNGQRVDSMNEVELTTYRSFYVGLIFQFHYLLNDFTALENVMLPGYMSGQKRGFAEERAFELLKEVGLEERLDHYPLQMSGGERQRVAVARALINDPDLILADEPTGNLDEKNSKMVEDILFALIENHQKTMLLVTHDLNLAERGTRQMQLEHGELFEL